MPEACGAMDGGAAPSVFDKTLSNMLRRFIGPGVRVRDRRLLANRVCQVTRLGLDGPAGTPDTVIVKHVPVSEFRPGEPSANPAFVGETAAYLLLAQSVAVRQLTPEMLGWDPSGILLLGDLGEVGNPVERTMSDLAPRIARALASLHGRTLDLEPQYSALLADVGWSTAMLEQRHYSPSSNARRAQSGRDTWLHLFKSGLSLADQARVGDELDEVRMHVEQYSGRKALIHDDLANARQTFEVGDETLLLDFESSYFALPLVDLAKPLLGKFEVNTAGAYLWSCPMMPFDLTRQYRAIMASEYGLVYTEDEWSRNLAACLIYAALMMLGNLTLVGSQRPLVAPPAAYINAILTRLGELLDPIGPFPAVTAIFRTNASDA
jgi:hypothetical protein